MLKRNFAAATLLVVSLGAVHSQQSPHANGHPQTNGEQRGAEGNPLFVKMIAPEPSKNALAKQEAKEQASLANETRLANLTGDLAFYTKLLAIGTGVLALLTGGLLIFGGLQLRDAKKTIKATENTATAAFAGVETTEKVMKLTQRAFLFLERMQDGPNIFDVPGGQEIRAYIFQADYKNVGATPARHIQSWFDHRTVDYSDAPNPQFEQVGDEQESPPVGPQIGFSSGFHAIPIADLMGAWNKTKRVYLWGRLEYRDVFSEEVRHTEMCMEVQPIRDPSILNHPGTGIGKRVFGYQPFGPQNGST